MTSNLHDKPDSPCIGVCSTLFDEVCKGCGRTALEVADWVFMTDAEKQAVWERITREGTAMRFQYDKL
ncbi:fe-s protein [Burkholderia pseudomallei]|nr:fe-s protein [Burkholderia pseudomallei]